MDFSMQDNEVINVVDSQESQWLPLLWNLMADHALLDSMTRLGKVSESLSGNRSFFSHVGKISDGKLKTQVERFG